MKKEELNLINKWKKKNKRDEEAMNFIRNIARERGYIS